MDRRRGKNDGNLGFSLIYIETQVSLPLRIASCLLIYLKRFWLREVDVWSLLVEVKALDSSKGSVAPNGPPIEITKKLWI